jgi:glutamyl-tRNA synthetase
MTQIMNDGTCPPLDGAVDGKVVTRFPPEPSGFLHIGHVKAVLINQYYAQRYNGRMLLRFDDTNPTKEKGEFEDNIIRDLDTLGVRPDSVSHTSDHFPRLEQFARQLIIDGLAYMDDTDQELMQKQRKSKQVSIHRDQNSVDALGLFDAMLSGAQGFCLRAKIDMNNVNGTMRDPVLYRSNVVPHHRTGTTYKAYPTYDFACPIVDSIEGVTHALRTTEYNDRDKQYHWIQSALRIRFVNIVSFGKMNFVHTVLSKRKLSWFVEQGLVDGWDDPRFPTVQGCARRGVQMTALKSFILSQGASRRVITMEWDKFWAVNKKVLEDICPRYMAIDSNSHRMLLIDGVDDDIVSVALHPSNPNLGTRVMRRGTQVLLDNDDASLLKVGEDITLLRWGNVLITDVPTDLTQPLRGKFDPYATNFSKTRKLTWLFTDKDNQDNLTPLCLVHFDHLILCAKLDDDDDFKQHVNPITRTVTTALGDPSLKLVRAGDVIQLERKGFFRCDRAYNSLTGDAAILFAIPDGRKSKK